MLNWLLTAVHVCGLSTTAAKTVLAAENLAADTGNVFKVGSIN